MSPRSRRLCLGGLGGDAHIRPCFVINHEDFPQDFRAPLPLPLGSKDGCSTENRRSSIHSKGAIFNVEGIQSQQTAQRCFAPAAFLGVWNFPQETVPPHFDRRVFTGALRQRLFADSGSFPRKKLEQPYCALPRHRSSPGAFWFP